MGKKYDDKLLAMKLEIEELDADNIKLRERLEDHERRIQMLEGPRLKLMNLYRELNESPLDMLAETKNMSEYDTFKWILPREAMFQATDKALFDGLLSQIEIGTMRNIRSLTSIRLTFNNGRKEYVSPRFGVNDQSKKADTPIVIKKIMAYYLDDCTCFLRLNGQDALSFGA